MQRNVILASLPESERQGAARRMELVSLPRGRVIFRGDHPDGSVYFPLSGLASIITTMSDGTVVEGAAVGADGWIGADLLAGAAAPGVMAVQQVAGSALRLHQAELTELLEKSAGLRSGILRFRGVLFAQALQTAACNRLHDTSARCARWLLFCSERMGTSELDITHAFLAEMLGTSRPAISAVVKALEREGFIGQARGKIFITDPEKLRTVACECATVLAQTYRRYIESLAAAVDSLRPRSAPERRRIAGEGFTERWDGPESRPHSTGPQRD